MRNFNKNVAKIVAIFFLFMAVGPAYGFGGNNCVSEAQKFVDVGRTDRAIEILRECTYREAKNFDAYWMYANLCMQRGSYDQADEQFGYAVNLKPGKQKEVMEKFKIAFTREVARGDTNTAVNLAQKLIGFEPTFKKQAYAAFYNKGKTLLGQRAVDNFKTALNFASNQGEREKIGKQYLKIALANPPSDRLVADAANIVGQNVVDQVIAKKSVQTIFSCTYTDADVDSDGKIMVIDYSRNNIQKGDTIIVSVTSSDGDDDVQVADGSKWLSVPDGGVYKVVCSNSIVNGGKIVKINRGKKIEVRAELIRTMVTKTNYAILDNL